MSDKAKRYITQQMSYGSLGSDGHRWIAEIEENERVAKLASRLFRKTVHELMELIDKQAQTAALVEAIPEISEYLNTCADNEHPDMSAVIYGWLRKLEALNNGGGN